MKLWGVVILNFSLSLLVIEKIAENAMFVCASVRASGLLVKTLAPSILEIIEKFQRRSIRRVTVQMTRERFDGISPGKVVKNYKNSIRRVGQREAARVNTYLSPQLP